MSLLQNRKPSSKRIALKNTLQLAPPVEPIHKQHSEVHPAVVGLTSYFSSSIGFKVRTKVTRHRSPIKYGYLELSKQFKQKPQKEDTSPAQPHPNIHAMAKEEKSQAANQSLFFISSKGFTVNPRVTAETLQIEGLKKARESTRDLPTISDARHIAGELKAKCGNSNTTTNFDFSTLPDNRDASNKTPILKEGGRVSPSFMFHYKPRIKTPHISKLLDHSGETNYTLIRAKTQLPGSHQNSVILTKDNSVDRMATASIPMSTGINTSSTPNIHGIYCSQNQTASVLRPSKKFIINQSSIIKSNSNVDLRLQTSDNSGRPVNVIPYPLTIKKKIPIFDYDQITSSGRNSIHTNPNSQRRILGSSRQHTKMLTGRSPSNSPRITDEIPALKLGQKLFAPIENELSSEGSTFRDYVQNAQNQDTTDEDI